MKGMLHELIVNSAIDKIPPGLRAILDLSTSSGSGKTKRKCILEGAVNEDSETEEGPLPDPDLQGVTILQAIVRDHWPDMEHFWNTDLEPHTGLTVSSESLGDPTGSFNQATYRSLLDRAFDYWGPLVIEEYKQNGFSDLAMDCLGRVLHLLTDAATPCHVHGDMHMNVFGTGLDDDDYEEYTRERVKDNNETLPWEWSCNDPMIVYKEDWDMPTYFYKMGEISRQYDSDNVDGTGTEKPYHWARKTEHIVNAVDWERDWMDDLTDYACDQIARNLIPTTIRHVAGLICHFFSCIGYYVALDTMDVSVTTLIVGDDTDPMGSGEIYLQANLGDQPLVYLGGEYDISSGEARPVPYNQFSVSVPDRNLPVHFRAHAYDDDSNFWSSDSESLGNIDYPIDVNCLPDMPVMLRAVSDNGYFGVDMAVHFHPKAQIVQTIQDIMHNFLDNTIMDIELLKIAILDEKKFPPAFVNTDTLAQHGLASGGSRYCKKWENLDPAKKLKVYMFDYELFKEVDGKTQLLHLVETIHGENSKQALALANVKGFKGHCSCLRIGWATDTDGR